ncbi:restriction endonuclease subunit S [Schaalia turicensis]|uniref:restriction endonuclease subunit S n=1 Tax=Schaalia turicensis TaxID=131111 RepID=UPI00189B52AA|nr:restriction endonuclease subunit S [Schaalia turicensis]
MNWKAKPLGSCIEVFDSCRRPVTKKDRVLGPYPYYGASGIVDYVDSYIFEGLHVLVAEDGENLRSRKLPIAYLADGRFWVNNHAHVLRANDENDTRFLSYMIESLDLSGFITGSTQPKLSQAALLSIPLRLPKLAEQRRIAGVLGVLDDKIESNQAVITHAEQLIDEIAVQRATDLPMVALSEVCSLSKSTWKPETSPDQTVQLFSLPAFDEGATPEQAAVASIKSNKTLMDRPGILVSRLNPRISRMWWVETDAARVNVCSPEFAYLTAGDMHGLACTWLAVRSPEFRGEIVDRVTGTSGSHQRVRPADLMTIGVPDYRSLAEHIQATMLTLLHLVSDRRRQSVGLAELRNALLPELMSGRMRVDEAGRLVSEALDEEVRSV